MVYGNRDFSNSHVNVVDIRFYDIAQILAGELCGAPSPNKSAFHLSQGSERK